MAQVVNLWCLAKLINSYQLVIKGHLSILLPRMWTGFRCNKYLKDGIRNLYIRSTVVARRRRRNLRARTWERNFISGDFLHMCLKPSQAAQNYDYLSLLWTGECELLKQKNDWRSEFFSLTAEKVVLREIVSVRLQSKLTTTSVLNLLSYFFVSAQKWFERCEGFLKNLPNRQNKKF